MPSARLDCIGHIARHKGCLQRARKPWPSRVAARRANRSGKRQATQRRRARCSLPSSMRPGRAGGRDELRHQRRCRVEGGIVENGQILPHGMIWRLGIMPFATRNVALPVGIGLDHAGIDREPSPPTNLSAMQRHTVVSHLRNRSLSRKRPCRFLRRSSGPASRHRAGAGKTGDRQGSSTAAVPRVGQSSSRRSASGSSAPDSIDGRPTSL